MNFCKYGSLKTPHKHWEVQLMTVPWRYLLINEAGLALSQQNFFEALEASLQLFGLFELSLYKTVRKDHAGWRFTFQVGPLHLLASVYDDRHWDDENDCWEVPVEQSSTTH